MKRSCGIPGIGAALCRGCGGAAGVPAQDRALRLRRDARAARPTPWRASSPRSCRRTLGQPVIVENRLGAGGLVGAKSSPRPEPDGHTIMMYASAFTVSHAAQPRRSIRRTCTPVATRGDHPDGADHAAREVQDASPEFVAAAKAQPGKLVCVHRRHRQLDAHDARALSLRRRLRGAERAHQRARPKRSPRSIAGRADCYFAPRVPGAEDARRRQGRRARGRARRSARRCCPTCRPRSRRATRTPTTTSGSARWCRRRRRARSWSACTGRSTRWCSRRRSATGSASSAPIR